MTIEQDVAALTTATTALLSAVNVAKVTLDTKVTSAANSASAAAATGATVSAVNSVATTQASAAAASALAASVSRDLSIAAWAASTAPAETLAAISQDIHAGAIVKSIIYDTSKDSDGGAWRKRCTDKSWFTETLGGNRWIGQRASVGAAWTAAGSTAGAVYQSTADGKYYSPTSATVQTEVFRGIAREFPEQAAIVAEAARVVIYDLTVPGCPMWMVFAGAANSLFPDTFYSIGTGNTSLAAINGLVSCGSDKARYRAVNFIVDSGVLSGGSWYNYKGNIAQRNSALGYAITALPSVLSSTVNDIAVTVLEGAPIDPATGLPVPTIAVATSGGVSVIRHDGTAVNSLVTVVSALALDSLGYIWFGQSTNGNYAQVSTVPISQLQANWPNLIYRVANSLPELYYGNIKETKVGKGVISVGGSLGFSTLKPNPTTPAKGMVAAITNAYNSGWQVGDSRGAWLSDTVAETIAAPELVVNGDFSSGASSWTPSAFSTVDSTGGVYSLTTTAGANWTEGITQTISGLIVGKTYVVSYSLISSSVRCRLVFFGAQAYSDAAKRLTVTATSSSSVLAIYVDSNFAGSTATFDNISVKLADQDRSVKSNGLSIVGSLTKTAVAAGAQLVAYSGFSAANYLEQPYSANLDFADDFSIVGWGLLGSSEVAGANWSAILSRANWAADKRFMAYLIAASGTARLAFGTASGTQAIPTGSWFQLACIKAGSTLSLYVNGVLDASFVWQSLWSSATQSKLLVGLGHGADGTGVKDAFSTGKLALLRISATAPSADQIAQIYRDELPLFQPGAQCTIAGTSTAVTALAYDDSTDLLHVGTSWGRSAFRGLLRTESEATTTGPITSLSAAQGAVLTGGTSAKIYQPALQLRDELARKEEAKRALGKVPVFIDITATSAQTAFVLAKGYTIKALYRNGVLMRETTTGVFWTRSHDGYQETATLSVGATVGDWISLMCVRSN